jgi:hypothetical protein
MQEIKLREASSKDIDLIANLAQLIWKQHYISLIGEKQVDYMLDLMYSAKALEEQILVKKHKFLLINASGEDLGFISLNETSNGNWFLNKFYINQMNATKGIGTKSFLMLLDIFKPNNITLTVNRGNYKSLNFYFKLGFKIEKTEVFDIGNGYVMDDFVMVWRKI